jgi:uncharacterized membrane protein YkoI
MNRTSLATMLAVVLALSQPAWAQGQGNGSGNSANGNGHGNSDGQEQSENSGGENNGQNGNGPGHRDTPGQGNGKGDGSPRANSELSEDDALAAVEAGRAVELETILPDVRARTGGEVINAQLQQVSGFLIYAVTVLTPSGQVLTEHYYARSGAHVRK